MKVRKPFELNECVNSVYQKYCNADKNSSYKKIDRIEEKKDVTSVTSVGILRY